LSSWRKTVYITATDATNWKVVLRFYQQFQLNSTTMLLNRHHRTLKVRTLRWEFGSVIPQDVKKNMSEKEYNWFTSYNKILGDYMLSYGGDGIDLTQSIKPPETLLITVQCVEARGEYQLDNGSTINLKKGSIHYLPREYCEGLIREGAMKQIKWNSLCVRVCGTKHGRHMKQNLYDVKLVKAASDVFLYAKLTFICCCACFFPYTCYSQRSYAGDQKMHISRWCTCTYKHVYENAHQVLVQTRLFEMLCRKNSDNL